MVSKPDPAQSDKWDFPVYQEELKTSQGINSGIHAVIRGDTGGVVGEYRGVKVIPNTELVQRFDDAISNVGYPISRKCFTTASGSRFWAEYQIGAEFGKVDKFSSIIRLQNSYNGSLTAGFDLEAMRLACLNGMMAMSKVFSMFERHSENMDAQRLTIDIESAVNKGQQQITDTIERMGNIVLNDNQARNVLSNISDMGKSNGVTGKTGLLIYRNWQLPSDDEKPLGDNLYRLYNAATRYCREVNKVGRFELSRRANTFVTGAFSLASNGSHNLEKLLATPKASLEFN